MIICFSLRVVRNIIFKEKLECPRQHQFISEHVVNFYIAFPFKGFCLISEACLKKIFISTGSYSFFRFIVRVIESEPATIGSADVENQVTISFFQYKSIAI